MWVLKSGRNGQWYEERRHGIEAERDEELKHTRERAEGELRRLYLEYHEEVPGDPPSSEPTYPLRGSTEWKKV